MALALALTPAAPGAAQPAADPRDGARAHFERGNALLAQGATEQALEEFRASRALFATRGNTQNLAIALQKLGRYDEAWEAYTELYQKFSLSDSEREQITRELESLRGLLGSLMVF